MLEPNYFLTKPTAACGAWMSHTHVGHGVQWVAAAEYIHNCAGARTGVSVGAAVFQKSRAHQLVCRKRSLSNPPNPAAAASSPKSSSAYCMELARVNHNVYHERSPRLTRSSAIVQVAGLRWQCRCCKMKQACRWRRRRCARRSQRAPSNALPLRVLHRNVPATAVTRR